MRCSGKHRQITDEEFEKERAWLVARLEATPLADKPGAETGMGEEDGDIECGCCFSTSPFVCFQAVPSI